MTILKDSERAYQCRGFGFGAKFLGGACNYSVSATELMGQQQQSQRSRAATEAESDCGGREEEEADEEAEEEEEGTSSTGCGYGQQQEEGEEATEEAEETRTVTPRKRSDTVGAEPNLPSIPEHPEDAAHRTSSSGTEVPSTSSTSASPKHPPRVRHRAGKSDRTDLKLSLTDFGAAASSQGDDIFLAVRFVLFNRNKIAWKMQILRPEIFS